MADHPSNVPDPQAEEPLQQTGAPARSDRLESWKEIASYLNREVRTVQRWEKREGLPVHRHQHDERASIFAYKAELDDWWHSGHSRLEKENGGDGSEEESSVVVSAASNGEATAGDKVKPLSRVGPPWRLWLAGAVVAAVVSSAITIFVLHHARTPALNFHPRDMVLIASFENRTGNPLFDGTLEAALARELTNSQFVSVAPRVRINDTLALMHRPADTRIDSVLGREICLRDGGIRAMITGRIEKFGSAFVLSAELVDPTSGRAVVSFEEQAKSQAGILPAIHLLSDRLRQSLGEDLSKIRQSDLALQHVTTPSLKALQLYSQANQMMVTWATRSQGPAFELLKQAIAEDPNFASAYDLAGYTLRNQGKSPSEYMPYFKRALELSTRATEPERYFIEASYYDNAGQSDKAVTAYEALLSIDPAHYWGLNNLEDLLLDQDRIDDWEDLIVRGAKLRPNYLRWNIEAANYLAINAEARDQARPYIERANALLAAGARLPDPDFDGIAWLRVYPAYVAWMENDVARARLELLRTEKSLDAQDDTRGRRALGIFYLTLGQARKANTWFRKVSPADIVVYEGGFALLDETLGDHAGLRDHLRRIARVSEPPGFSAPLLMVREGLLREASASIPKHSKPGGAGSFREATPVMKLMRGSLYLAAGKKTEGLPLLREGVRGTRDLGIPAYFLGAEILARAYEKQGSLSFALQVLEDASSDRPRVDFYAVPMAGAPFWMRDQMDLAHLYRRLGRVQDARKIEDELRKLLAYADPDFPLLAELKKLQNTTSVSHKLN